MVPYLGKALSYVRGRALSKHLHSAVVEIADKAGQHIAAGDSMGRESKSYALDPADEYYLLGGVLAFHCAGSRLSYHNKETHLVCYAADDNSRNAVINAFSAGFAAALNLTRGLSASTD